VEGKAGYFKRGSTQVYRIKYGVMPWQQVDIKKLPDPRYMVDNKAFFMQYQVGELVQAKSIINWETGDIKIDPVDNTTKAAAKSELIEYADVFSKKSLLKENVGIVIMGFILVAGIVAIYFVSKACGG
jgi:hypothetical protein